MNSLRRMVNRPHPQTFILSPNAVGFVLMARLLPDPPSRTGGILTKREMDAALRVLSTLRQSQPATVMLSWDNDMQDILQGLGRARYVETLPAYGGRNPKSTAPFKPDVMKTTPLGLEYLESIQAAQRASPARHHATNKSPAQLDREIATALAQQPGKSDRYYVAHPDEVAEVTIVLRGLGNYNVKRRYKKPVRVRNVSDGDEFFVEESELFRDPGAAGAHSAELARKALGIPGAHSSHQHSTRRGGPPRPQQEFECYWEVDGRKHSWPVDAKDAISAARTFAAEHDVTDNPADPTAVCVVVPQKGDGRGPSGPPERFRAYPTGGKLRVEPLGNRRSSSRSRGKPPQTPQQKKIRAAELKAEARALQALGAAAPKRRVLAIDRQFREVLGGLDPFWISWSAFIDGEGGGRIGPSWRKS